MNVLENSAVRGFIRMCGDGWRQGWHERNGGNLTYRMTKEEAAACAPAFDKSGPFVPMGVADKRLAGACFLTTGSGKFLRNVEDAPAENIGIVQISESGDAWQIVWGLCGGGRPTSEFPSHFLNHSVKAALDPAYRVIYHAHTPAVIALTYLLPLDARTFSRALWQSATECPVVFPSGVGVVEWMVPGGAEIARATSACMQDFDAVIWAHHGMFCAGPDFDTTFGLMHTVEKAADVYLRVLSSGQPIRQTITDENLRAIARDFGVRLREDFLD